MDLSRFHPSRRDLIRTLLLGACMAPAVMAVLKNASAQSKQPLNTGFQTIVGDVRVNGDTVQVGDKVRPGDICTTGADSHCVIVIGEHVLLLREHSEVEFEIEHFDDGLNTSLSERIRIFAGALMAVFGKTEAALSTPLATIGIRGTGIYMEVLEDRDYVCLCYGQAAITSKLNPEITLNLDTFHHDAPHNLYTRPEDHDGMFLEPEKMINHMDEELILLESLVGRIPLFGPKPIKMPDNK